MHLEELQEQDVCASCGAEIQPHTERPFPFGDELLCYECALARGGSYDAVHDHWIAAPDLSGLVDERRPHP